MQLKLKSIKKQLTRKEIKSPLQEHLLKFTHFHDRGRRGIVTSSSLSLSPPTSTLLNTHSWAKTLWQSKAAIQRQPKTAMTRYCMAKMTRQSMTAMTHTESGFPPHQRQCLCRQHCRTTTNTCRGDTKRQRGDTFSY